eukprot:TRINITY_DN1986_c0_g1_i1.p1 TRINITY_DN1986_c0_g1~~TRINITY_DN1986_c0_g1_i1.p1  ORF type:complete len:149 (-),score=30.57 TRINITY_DN1986_c0_g1_i1:295-741(-)
MWQHFSIAVSWIVAYCRSVAKAFLHMLTGKSEIERILSSSSPPPTPSMIRLFDSSISSSKRLKGICDALKSASTDIEGVMTAMFHEKKIVGHHEKSSIIRQNALQCLENIQRFNHISATVTKLKIERYDSSNTEHEQLLMKVYFLSDL